MTLPKILLVIVTNVFFAASSVFFKLAVDKIGKFDFSSIAAFMPVAIRFLLSPLFLFGIAAGIAGSACYYVMLSRMNLNVAYPLLSLGYIFVAIASVLFLNESLHLTNWLGIGLICAGIVLITLKTQ